MGGRAPTVGVESKLQPRGESYKKQLLGMWMEFSLNVFHEKISKFIFFPKQKIISHFIGKKS